ncbi:hypothetical protein ABZ345_08780 [Lentzea sp. NPDC005914]|uniref:hypothetical protein n=1 Tax=Lentzea sp. NPDC005914 TaxID=3154572 RepID=UPI0033EBE765
MDFELAECRYYGVFRDGVGSVDRASMLVRKLEAYREEEYAGHGLWVETEKLYQIDSGRDMNSDYRQLTEAEELQLRQEIDASWAANWHHHVVSADAVPFAVVLTAKNHRSRPVLIARDGHRGRTETDLLDRAPEESWAVEEAEPAAVPEILARIEVRRREEAGLTGGYAVFRRLADALDLVTASAVVPERSEEHEFTVRLALWETEHVAGLVRLRNAKRRAAPVDGRQHFALFQSISAAADMRNAHSAVRSTVDSRRWEMFLRPGEWLPASRPPQHRTVLPLGPDDLETVLARLGAAESRYLEVRGTGRVALLRLTGTTEEFAVDLGWEPSDVLTRLPGEDSWSVSEIDERTMTNLRFDVACLGRSGQHRDGEYEYIAVFPARLVALDLSHAQLVIRRRDEAEEKFAGPARGWEPASPEERGATAYPSRRLPISRAEMERLIS